MTFWLQTWDLLQKEDSSQECTYVRTYVRTHMHGEEGREKTNATEKDGEEKKDGEQMSELILN